uniref:RNA-directed DNA polymerase n=1 Tax=Trichuris muris TaxID=70415 RepID=A0A5S6QAL9_TRIMR
MRVKCGSVLSNCGSLISVVVIEMAHKCSPVPKREEKSKTTEKKGKSSPNDQLIKIYAIELEAAIDDLQRTNPAEYKALSTALCARFLPAKHPFDATGVFSGSFALFLLFFQLYLLRIVGLPVTISVLFVSSVMMLAAGIELFESGNSLGITATIFGSLGIALSLVMLSPMLNGFQPTRMDFGFLLFAFTFVAAAFMISSVTRYILTIVVSTATFIGLAAVNAAVLAGGVDSRLIMDGRRSARVSLYQGSLEQFDVQSGSEGWDQWTERFEIFAEANHVPEADRSILLLNHCGPEAYRLMREAVAPDKPSAKSFNELVQAVKEKLDPIPGVYAARAAFYARTPQPGESVAAFMTELRRLAVRCQFEATPTVNDRVDSQLHDQLLTGMAVAEMRRHVLRGPKLTLKELYIIEQFCWVRRAIKLAPPPKDVKQLQAFLGMLNFYSVFLPKKATVLEPLHRLLDAPSRAHWRWGPEEQAAFEAPKELLTADAMLAHFDGSKPLILACDASDYGLGAVLFGRHFTAVTDHRPLLGLLATKKPTPTVMSARMLRWRLFLMAYDVNLVYCSGKAMGNADGLSRLPLPTDQDNRSSQGEGCAEAPLFVDVLMMETEAEEERGEVKLLDTNTVAKLRRKDPVLSCVLHWVLRGWPSWTQGDHFSQFVKRRDELSAARGCLLWGSRVVIPKKLQRSILEVLHHAHPGMARMKALARSYVWWPGIDSEIERRVTNCDSCQRHKDNPPTTPPRIWNWSARPWSRIHIDFAGPLQGKRNLLVVDFHSKWVEVEPVSSTDAKQVIYCLARRLIPHSATASSPAEILLRRRPKCLLDNLHPDLLTSAVKAQEEDTVNLAGRSGEKA